MDLLVLSPMLVFICLSHHKNKFLAILFPEASQVPETVPSTQ